MSDITGHRDAPASGMVDAVPMWTGSESLSALEDAMEVAAAVPAAVARRASMSTSEIHSLRHLMRAPIGPVDLAKSLGITTAASSGVVDRLVAHGHAERRPHGGDGRRVEVVITPSGRSEVLELLAPMFARLAEVDSLLSEEERAIVTRYLRGAIVAMRAVM
ncbi:MAG TPA: MarR family transcriptional regulator [Tetrasphaera sp.]|uniref:MarR family winged helix-turn-helix transcriptional regulator n=1 Tax=Nostocoides sp. TaxID=1917966 RepID=UPI002CDAE5EA|nr:MarR family transcriptional regulator [Tetrasphaera sp.]HNQ08198.1 MarR family transcriptional regulator [Tetrasphaera sp.]